MNKKSKLSLNLNDHDTESGLLQRKWAVLKNLVTNLDDLVNEKCNVVF